MYEPKQDCIYAFGQGGNGQLGLNSTVNTCKPAPVIGPWKSSRKRSPESGCLGAMATDKNVTKTLGLKRIFCGGDRSFALFVPYSVCLVLSFCF